MKPTNDDLDLAFEDRVEMTAFPGYHIDMNDNAITPFAAATVEEMSRKYLWWKAIAAEGHPVERMIAQIMRFGTYEDIRELESVVGPHVLATVMGESAPGWFDDRSWDFWRGRLSVAGITDIDERRPQRTFAHANMF